MQNEPNQTQSTGNPRPRVARPDPGRSRLFAGAAGWWLVLCLLGSWVMAAETATASAQMRFVRVADDQRGFCFEEDRKPFVPWGFNYDHDRTGRLLEDYWEAEWPKVEEDFREAKQLGAKLVTVTNKNSHQ